MTADNDNIVVSVRLADDKKQLNKRRAYAKLAHDGDDGEEVSSA
jgi:hypothetical protein